MLKAAKEWERKIGITQLEIEGLVKKPEQIVPGDLGAFVAQTRSRNGLLRVPFKETEAGRKF